MNDTSIRPVAPAGLHTRRWARLPAFSRRALRQGAMLIALGLATVPGAARADALAQLREFVADTRSARGQFTQRQVRANGQAGATSSGAFSFQRPGRFRWEVKKPFAQTIVADGQRLHIFDPDLNQVIVRRIGSAAAGTPAAILFGGEDLERNFDAKDAGRRDGLEWIEAVPKNRDAGFERIAIGFGNGLPAAMEIHDSFGQTTVLAFAGIERNPALGAEAFRFVAPKGADVIEQ